jgi:hypothetical protein
MIDMAAMLNRNVAVWPRRLAFRHVSAPPAPRLSRQAAVALTDATKLNEGPQPPAAGMNL